METFYSDGWTTCVEGDASAVLESLAEQSVHCVITSPPYWALRDYGSDGQLGLEPTPDEYVADVVAACRAIKRVLRDDGTFWLVLGDTYSSSGGERDYGSSDNGTGRAAPAQRRQHAVPAKNLVGIPWRVAFALQEDGWFLRSDIVWAKPNAMPESVEDRPGKAHEYVFLFSKTDRYYYDFEAVREPAAGATNGETRNLRDVWGIPLVGYSASHFATFPKRLVVPMIRAGTSARGVCAECGAPWERVTEVAKMVLKRSTRTHDRGQTRASGAMVAPRMSKTVGWRPTCPHPDAAQVPATVLDPFAGSGTVGLVARHYLRRSILVDLDRTYMEDRVVTGAEYETARGLTNDEWEAR